MKIPKRLPHPREPFAFPYRQDEGERERSLFEKTENGGLSLFEKSSAKTFMGRFLKHNLLCHYEAKGRPHTVIAKAQRLWESIHHEAKKGSLGLRLVQLKHHGVVF